MYCNFIARAALVFLALAALTNAVPDGRSSVSLKKRMNAGSSWDEDLVSFDQLHNHVFQHPAPSAPISNAQIEERWPTTYLFNNKPVLFTDSQTPLDFAKLLQAYNDFGKVHIADTEHRRFLTLQSSHQPLGELQRQPEYDEGLERFVSTAQAFERHYGKNLAAVLFGPELNKVHRDEMGKPTFKPEPWSKIKAARAMTASGSTEELRQELRERKYIKYSSEDGESHLAIRFNTDGSLQERVLGNFHKVNDDTLAFLHHV